MKTLIALGLMVSAATATVAQDRVNPDRIDPGRIRSGRITPGNVSRLAVAWTYDTRDPTTNLGGKPPGFQVTPVYDAGRLYVSSPQGTVAAVDAETGAEIWRTDLGVNRNAGYSDPQNRGPSLRGDRLYVGTIDARLICVQVRDGRRCQGFGTNGEVDLTRGLRRAPEWKGEYGLTSPPAIFKDLVIVGSAVADNSRARMASGEVRAFDATTGALRWTFHPLREDAQAGGANTWSRIGVDESRGLVFLGTGSPSPDYFGGLRPGKNEYANSLVVLKGATGEVAWHFQTVHHDLWDYDVAAPPLLFPFRTARGETVPAVVVGPKSGNAFFFNRETGEPLFPIEERRVPASDIPGEDASPTQPFPTRPAAFGLQQLSESDVWGPTAEDREACLRTFRSLRNEGVYTPPSVRGTLSVPGNIGGLHWGGMAWDEKNRLIIAPINRLPAIMRSIPQAEYAEARRAFRSRETTEQKGAPFAMSREWFMGPSGMPCVKPPWGELVAVHADSGERAWSVPLGDIRSVAPNGGTAAPGPSAATPDAGAATPRAGAATPRAGAATPDAGAATPDTEPMGSPNLGGPATTETGLVFIGATLDPFLRAFDTSTGREVWSARLPTSARATPLIFTSPSGRHMVAIAAGGHDYPTSRIDTKLVVFALPINTKSDSAKRK